MEKLKKLPKNLPKNLPARVTKMIEFYEQSHTLDEVGEEFGGLSKARIGQIFKEAGYQARTFTFSRKMRMRPAKKPSVNIIENELRQSYEIDGESAKSIARRFDSSPPTVRRLLIFYRIPVRNPREAALRRCGQKNGLTDEVLRDLRLEKKMTVAEIAEAYGYLKNSIHARLQKIGLGRKGSGLLNQKTAF